MFVLSERKISNFLDRLFQHLLFTLTLRFLTCRKEYSLEELKQKPPPEGVDPSRLETYLSEADFEVRTAFLFELHLQSVQPDCWQIKEVFKRGL